MNAAFVARVAALALLAVSPTALSAAKPPEAKSERADKASELAALRGALRTAMAQLAARAFAATNNATPPRTLPLTAFVAGVAFEDGADGETGSAAKTAAPDALAAYRDEATTMRGTVVEFAGAVVAGNEGNAVFVLREPTRPRKGHVSPLPTTDAAAREAARKLGADYAIEETVQSVASDSAGTRASDGAEARSVAHIALQVVDAREGTIVCVADTALPTMTVHWLVDRKN